MQYASEATRKLAGKNVLVWFRRDLRLDDHAALAAALGAGAKVFCLFVFDTEILEPLLARGLKHDRRVEFIHHALIELDAGLRSHGGALLVRHAKAQQAVPEIAQALGCDMVVANHDYEPAAACRDALVQDGLSKMDIGFLSFKDQVIFERDELLTGSGNFYSVFTPYKRSWLKALSAGDYAERVTLAGANSSLAMPSAKLQKNLPTLEQLGFAKTNLDTLRLPLGASGAKQLTQEFATRIEYYRQRRDFPSQRGPSYLSVHLRFGTVSVRALVRVALEHQASLSSDDQSGAATWLSELIWRDFYAQVLFHRPDLERHSFRREYDQLEWLGGADAKTLFAAWCAGQTGYPLVDAAMRQINHSGYMHNRLRMVTASFLTKDLGIDWRWGEGYFADQLNDYDLASNNGGWQWSASTGCDAQPYFRIFNPVSQSEKFDASGDFIRTYVPELARLSSRDIHAPWRIGEIAAAAAGFRLGRDYPAPIVDHDKARKQTLQRFNNARSD